MTYYLWLDLETTGLDDEDEIVEVAVILTGDAPRFDELGRYSTAVEITATGIARLEANEFVTAMHKTSGLYDVLARRSLDHVFDPDVESLPSLKVADYAVAQTIATHLGVKHRGTVHLAGSGVSHFDLRRVVKGMPQTAGWLHWRPLDVGQLEEWRKLLGHETFDQAFPAQAERKTHRAADDIAYHLDEARWYLSTDTADV
jgi:oligoribonuclease (3'-5' exoribonuclease)